MRNCSERIAAALATLGLLVTVSVAAAEDGAEPAAKKASVTGFAAYTVYTYNGGPQGMAGRIRDNGKTVKPIPNLRSGLNGDPQVEGFVTNAGPRIVVTNRIAEPDPAPPTYIFDATPKTNPTPLFTRTWPNVRNMFGLVQVGKYLYAIDYDNARVTEINRSNFKETGVTFTLPEKLTPTGYIPRGQALIVADGQLFGLFSFSDSSFASYKKSLLVRFTTKGGVSIKVGDKDYNDDFVENAFAIAASGPDLYVAGIGGSPSGGSYNKASRLQKITFGAKNLKKADVTDVLKPSDDEPYEIRDVSFNGSTAYVLLGAYDVNFTLQGKLVSTKDFKKLKTINDFTSGAPGYYWAAQYTPGNNRLWFAHGNDILVYDAGKLSKPVATLTLDPGSLLSSGDPYDNLNDLAYVGADGSKKDIRGYRSPIQASQSPRARAARAIAKGRPELTEDEKRRLDQ